MDATVAVDLAHEPALVDDDEGESSRATEMERWRILALIALCLVAGAGWAFALVREFAEPRGGSSAGSIEELLRRSEDPSVVGLAILIGLTVAIVWAAAIATLHRHAD